MTRTVAGLRCCGHCSFGKKVVFWVLGVSAKGLVGKREGANHGLKKACG